jgi:hypothetical protein
MLPAPIAEHLRAHLDTHVAVGDQALIFSVAERAPGPTLADRRG